MSLPVLSYFTTINVGGFSLQYFPTSTFIVNGQAYTGVIKCGNTSTDFLIDQTATYHRIKIGQNQYVTLLQISSGLPTEVLNILGNTSGVGQFFTTCNNEIQSYFVTSTDTPTQSTVDLNVTTTGFYVCQANTPNFWLTFGNIVYTQPNNGSPFTVTTVTASNTYTTPGGGIPIVHGNQTLLSSTGVPDFTATIAGPVLGAADTGLLMPGFGRDNSYLTTITTTPGEPALARFMPTSGIIGPDVSQRMIADRGVFNSMLTSISASTTNFGASLAITDTAKFLAIADTTPNNGGIYIYSIDISATQIQNFLSPADTTLGGSMKFSSDGSILAYTLVNQDNGNILIYKYGNAQWVLANALITQDTTIGANQYKFDMSKDGRTIIFCSNTAYVVGILEDTSVPGDWSNYVYNSVPFGSGAHPIDCICISPEGSIIYATGSNPQPGYISQYVRRSLGTWSENTNIIRADLPTNQIVAMRTNYNGRNIISIAATGNYETFTIIGNSILYEGDINGDGYSNPSGLAGNTSMSMVISGGAGAFYETGIVGNVFNNLTSVSINAQAYVTEVAIADNNINPVIAYSYYDGSSSSFVNVITNSYSANITYINSELINFNNTLEITPTYVAPLTGNIVDLGSPSNPWNNVYLNNNLYINGSTTVPAFSNGTATPTLTSADSTLQILPVVQQLNWNQNGTAVYVSGTIQWSDIAYSGAGSAVSITLDNAIPGPPLVSNVIGQITPLQGAFNLTTYPIFIIFVSSTQLDILSYTSSSGVTVPLTGGSGDPLPSINSAGMIAFNISYSV